MCFLIQIAKKVWFAASQSRFYREIRELSGNYGFEFRRSSKNSQSLFYLSDDVYTVLYGDLRITVLSQYVMHCAIWYHLFNLKNVKNTHGGVLLLFKLQASATGSILETRGWYIKKFSIAAAMLSNSNSFDDALHSHLYFFLSSLLSCHM